MASQFVYGRSIRSRVGRSSAFFHQRIFGASHRHKRVHTHLSLSLSPSVMYGDSSIFDWVLIRLIRSIRLVLLELDLVISSSAWDKVASDPSAVNFRMWNVYVLASVGQAAPAAPFLTPFFLQSSTLTRLERKVAIRILRFQITIYYCCCCRAWLMAPTVVVAKGCRVSVVGCRCCQILRNLIEV